MELGSLLILLLVLACPLAMIWMMRGHGGHGAGHGAHGSRMAAHERAHGDSHEGDAATSLDELRRRQDELEAKIALLEQSENSPQTPAAV